jgi:hypothetical protein
MMSQPLCPTPARLSTRTPGLSPGPHSTAVQAPPRRRQRAHMRALKIAALRLRRARR